MIKPIFCCFSLLLFAGSLFSQTRGPRFTELPINTKPIRFSRSGINPDQREGIAWGIKAGLNLAEFSGSGYFNDRTGYAPISPKRSFLTGYTVGLLAEIPVTDQFYIQPELDFTLSGNKVRDSSYAQTVKLGYLDLPILLKYKPFEGVSLFAGPQLDYLLFAGYSSVLDAKSYSGAVKPSFKAVGFSGVAGLGFGFTANFGIEARYTRSLANINKVYDGNNFKTTGIQLALRYFY